MSLESDVANLVTKTESLISYFNTKKAGIDSAVAAAIAAVPGNYKRFYVHPVTGLDTNEGTAEKPLKTIDKAISNTPYGGTVDIFLQADYPMQTNITVDSRFIHFRSDVSGLKRKVTSVYYQTGDNSATYMAGMVMFNGAQIMASDITFVFPSPAGQNPVPLGFTNSFFKTNSNAGNVLAPVKLSSCEVQAAADWIGWVVGSPNSAIIFEILGVTFPAGFSGRYIYGTTAGANPNTLSNLLTNLTTL